MVYTPPVPLRNDHELQVKFTASGTHAISVRALISNRLKSPPTKLDLELELRHSAGDRTTETTELPLSGGFLWGFSIFARGELKRGQVYCEVFLSRFGIGIKVASGYVYAGHDLMDGEFTEPGPGSGRGFLDWVQLADDIAGNVNSALPLAATNTRRLITEIRLLYHASGDVANRTMTLRIRDRGTESKPTGWTISDTSWLSPTLTLTQNEEGSMWVGKDGFLSVNDAGVVTTPNNTTAPHPFPFWVEEGDPVDLLVSIGLGEAADDYDVWALIEEWLDP